MQTKEPLPGPVVPAASTGDRLPWWALRKLLPPWPPARTMHDVLVIHALVLRHADDPRIPADALDRARRLHHADWIAP